MRLSEFKCRVRVNELTICVERWGGTGELLALARTAASGEVKSLNQSSGATASGFRIALGRCHFEGGLAL